MPIPEGVRIPSLTLKQIGDDGMEDVSTDSLFSGRTVVLFGVPGAFTPSCAHKHVPGYIEHADKIRARGVDAIVCLSVNDPFVMKEWENQSQANGAVSFLPDGNAELTRALGLDFDASAAGLGVRSRRFAAIVEDGTIRKVFVEDSPGSVDVSSAEKVLNAL